MTRIVAASQQRDANANTSDGRAATMSSQFSKMNRLMQINRNDAYANTQENFFDGEKMFGQSPNSQNATAEGITREEKMKKTEEAPREKRPMPHTQSRHL